MTSPPDTDRFEFEYAERLAIVDEWRAAVIEIDCAIEDPERKKRYREHYADICGRLSVAHVFPDRTVRWANDSTAEQNQIVILPLTEHDEVTLPELGINSSCQAYTNTQFDVPIIVLPRGRNLNPYEKALVLDHEVVHAEECKNDPDMFRPPIPEEISAMMEWRAYLSGIEKLKLIEGEGLDEYINFHVEQLRASGGWIGEDDIRDFPTDTVVYRYASRPSGFINTVIYFAIIAEGIDQFVSEEKKEKAKIKSSLPFIGA